MSIDETLDDFIELTQDDGVTGTVTLTEPDTKTLDDEFALLGGAGTITITAEADDFGYFADHGRTGTLSFVVTYVNPCHTATIGVPNFAGNTPPVSFFGEGGEQVILENDEGPITL